jgi:hypothetical protein
LVPGTEQLNQAKLWNTTVLCITVPYQIFLHPFMGVKPKKFPAAIGSNVTSISSQKGVRWALGGFGQALVAMSIAN